MQIRGRTETWRLEREQKHGDKRENRNMEIRGRTETCR
jgi:hypothetical protein